jgi:hypothetical protein
MLQQFLNTLRTTLEDLADILIGWLEDFLDKLVKTFPEMHPCSICNTVKLGRWAVTEHLPPPCKCYRKRHKPVDNRRWICLKCETRIREVGY